MRIGGWCLHVASSVTGRFLVVFLRVCVFSFAFVVLFFCVTCPRSLSANGCNRSVTAGT